MNAEKAREFFSAYHEGSLDRGLKQSFERRLEADARLQAEYQAFVQTVKELEGLSIAVPEPPFDLHERVSARLDRYLFEQQRKPAPMAWMRWRSAAIAAVAVLAVLGGALSIVRRGNQFGSGILPPTASPIADQLSVTMRDGEPTLIFRTGSVRTLILRSVTENKVLKHVDLDGTSLAAGIVLRSPLRYASDSATLLRVDITGDATSTAIALPGGKRTEAAKGHGALVALALAMADRYGVVVVVPGNQTRELSWDLQSADPMESASEALQGTPTVAERRTSGIIWLQ